jgi:hypothetical protein
MQDYFRIAVMRRLRAFLPERKLVFPQIVRSSVMDNSNGRPPDRSIEDVDCKDVLL